MAFLTLTAISFPLHGYPAPGTYRNSYRYPLRGFPNTYRNQLLTLWLPGTYRQQLPVPVVWLS